MRVVALNVGPSTTHEYQGRTVTTGFFKYPAEGALHLGTEGFPGDMQADRVHHGGPEKATLLYSREHYAYWEREMGRDPGPAAMGENLTVEGLTEETVCIGDVYRIGGATVQVCQPRIPCFKTVIRHPDMPDMVDRVNATGYSGFYVRVLGEGPVAAGDPITLLERPDGAPTVAFANRIFHHDKENLEGARQLVENPALAKVWKDYLGKRLG